MTDARDDEDDRNANAAGKAIDSFSIEVLGYNRRHPEPGQPSPGSTLRRAELAMADREARKKWLGRILILVASGVVSVFAGIAVPWIIKKLG